MNMLANLLTAIVRIKVENKEDFSVYNITQAARSCTSQNIDHEDVKLFVHNYMLDVSTYRAVSNGTFVEYKYIDFPTEKLTCFVKSKNRVTIPKNIIDELFGNVATIRFDGKIVGNENSCPNGIKYIRERGYSRIRVPSANKNDHVTFIIHSDKLELE